MGFMFDYASQVQERHEAARQRMKSGATPSTGGTTADTSVGGGTGGAGNVSSGGAPEVGFGGASDAIQQAVERGGTGESESSGGGRWFGSDWTDPGGAVRLPSGDDSTKTGSGKLGGWHGQIPV